MSLSELLIQVLLTDSYLFVAERWPYTGKRYFSHFGPVPHWILNSPGPHSAMNNTPNPQPGPGAGPGPHLSSPPPVVGVPPAPGAPIAVPGAPGTGSTGSTPGVGQPEFQDPNAAAAGGYVYYAPYPYPGVSLLARLIVTGLSLMRLLLFFCVCR